jgi:hypothetical protein
MLNVPRAQVLTSMPHDSRTAIEVHGIDEYSSVVCVETMRVSVTTKTHVVGVTSLKQTSGGGSETVRGGETTREGESNHV